MQASVPIAHVDGIVLSGRPAPSDQMPQAQVLIVRITTEDGRVGLGECNHSPNAASAFLASDEVFSEGRGVRAVLIGRDPRDHTAVYSELIAANTFTARRGIARGVLAAIDVALWDLAAQIEGMPLWKRIWGDQPVRGPRPYATIYTGASTYEQALARIGPIFAKLAPLGHAAIKCEPTSDCVPEAMIGPYVSAVRQQIGSARELFVDLGYRMPTAERALAALRAIEPCKIGFCETPCLIDDLYQWGATSRESPIPIAGAELLEAAWDFELLMEVGRVHVVQPWINRLGITGTLDVIGRANDRGVRTVLAGWNTTPIGIAAGIHVAAGLGPEIVLEHAPTEAYNFDLRHVAGPDPKLVGDAFALPRAPGLGITLDVAEVARLRA